MLRCAIAALSAVLVSAACADPVEDFYKNKTLKIIVGMNPPDQHDNDARSLSRHMGKYLPGNPSIIVQNMPGAGSLKAVQYLASVAERDGTAIGIAQRGMMMMPLLGYTDAKFDPVKFTWIGTRAGETSIAVMWHESATKNMDDAMRRETITPSTGGGADSITLPAIYNETLGTKFKVITGYSGGGDMNLALERGEADGRVGWSVGAMRGTKEEWFRDKKVNVILQHGLRPSPVLPGVPLAQNLAKNEADRQLLELFAARQEIGFPVFGPPGIPADRVKALREAYQKTMKDSVYIDEIKKMNVELDPLSGEEMQALVDKIYAYSPEVVSRARTILMKAGAIPK